MSLRTQMMMATGRGNSLLSGLISYWKLDGSANDARGINNGTATSVTYVSSEKIGQCASFNGSTSKISVPYSTSINSPSTAVSCAMWLCPANVSSAQVPLFKQVNSSSHGNYYFYIGSGNIYAGTNNATVTINGGSITANQWIHVCLVFTHNTKLDLYVDGTLAASSTSSPGAITPANYDLFIGWHPSIPFSGKCDEVGLWSRALTATEITKLYNSGVGKQYPFGSSSPNSLHNSLIAGWNLEGNAYDLVSTNHGTATNVMFSPANGKIGEGAGFDGTNASRIVIADFPEFHFDSGDFTISLWLRRSMISNNEEFFFGQCSASGSNSTISVLMSIEPDNKVNGTVCSGIDAVAVRSNSSITNSNWYHVLFQRKGNDLKLYYNGSNESNIQFTDSVNMVTENIGIGSGGDYVLKNFKGNIDCVYVHNRALSTVEIAYLYNSGNGRQYPF